MKKNPTIVFDRACSVDEMFDALMEQSRQYYEESGKPMPPPHPSDLIPHPNPIAPLYVGEAKLISTKGKNEQKSTRKDAGQ
jgi:hypothetical protein